MAQAVPPDLAAALGIEVFDFGPLAGLYRPVEAGEWKLAIGANIPSRGYWSGLKLVREVPVLTRGHVVIMGLGMGWVAAETALREAVSMVTIVERDAQVIALHRELDLFARLPGGAGEKVRILTGDALAWRPDHPVDLLMPDIWLNLVEGDRVPDMRRMQDNVGAQAIYFWGQELEIARHAAAAGRRLDTAGVGETVRDWALPLVIPAELDYPGIVRAAARQWMRGRWFAPEHAAILDAAPLG